MVIACRVVREMVMDIGNPNDADIIYASWHAPLKHFYFKNRGRAGQYLYACCLHMYTKIQIKSGKRRIIDTIHIKCLSVHVLE